MGKEPKIKNNKKDEIILENEYGQPPLQWEEIQALWSTHKDSLHKYITELYKNYFMYTQDRKGQLEKDKETWRSNIKSPLTNMFVSGIYNLLQDSDIRFVCVDVKWNKPDETKNILDLVEYVSWQDEFMNAIWDAVFDQCLLGWWVFKLNYVYFNEAIKYIDNNGQKKEIQDKTDYVSARYVSPYNIFSMASTNYANNRMLFERRLVPSTKLLKEYSKFQIKPDTKAIKDKGQPLDTIDYEAIKTNIPFYNNANGRDIFDDDTYNVRDKMIEVVEAHTDKTISIWFNWIYHGTYEQLGGVGMKYHFLSFKRNPWTRKGIGVGYIVRPIQQAYDEVLNLRLDNVKLAMNKMFFMEASSSIFGQTPVMKIKPWAIYKVRDVDSFKEIQTSEVKNSAYTELDTMFQMTQWLTGISASFIGMQQKVERTATGAEMLKNSADAQTKQPLRSIAAELAKATKEMVVMLAMYMDKETIKKICGEDEKFSSLLIEDLIGGFNFSYDMTSNGSLNKAIQNEQLMQLLDKQDRTLDAQGRQVLNVRAIIEKLATGMNLGFDATLSEEEMMEAQKLYEQNVLKQQQELQSIQQENQPKEEPSSVAGKSSAGLVPTEMMPNPTGENEPKGVKI